jgi:hypothetical protein
MNPPVVIAKPSHEGEAIHLAFTREAPNGRVAALPAMQDGEFIRPFRARRAGAPG